MQEDLSLSDAPTPEVLALAVLAWIGAQVDQEEGLRKKIRAPGTVWERINAGHRDKPVRGRFYSDQTLYRVLWAAHSGSTAASPALTIPGQAVGPSAPGSRRIPGRDF